MSVLVTIDCMEDLIDMNVGKLKEIRCRNKRVENSLMEKTKRVSSLYVRQQNLRNTVELLLKVKQFERIRQNINEIEGEGP